jgi:hypothetical protein
MVNSMEIAVARFAFLVALIPTIASCAVLPPPGEDGTPAISQASAVAQNGTIDVSDGTTQCRGEYDPAGTSKTLQVALKCDDGRTGTASMTRSADQTSGAGTVSLSDGAQWEFLIGRATELI